MPNVLGFVGFVVPLGVICVTGVAEVGCGVPCVLVLGVVDVVVVDGAVVGFGINPCALF